jgi:hypothetical protein
MVDSLSGANWATRQSPSKPAVERLRRRSMQAEWPVKGQDRFAARLWRALDWPFCLHEGHRSRSTALPVRAQTAPSCQPSSPAEEREISRSSAGKARKLARDGAGGVIDRSQDARHSAGPSGARHRLSCLELASRKPSWQRSCATATTDRTYDRNRSDSHTAKPLASRGPSTYGSRLSPG